jgi:glycine/D-amino acid oxidase-like deaminating enzyme
MKVTVLGAGIAGLSAAHALVKRSVEVTVIYKNHGATAHGAGIVSAQFWDEQLVPYGIKSQEIIRQLVPINPCGMAQIALSDETADLLEGIKAAEQHLPSSLEASFSKEFSKQIRSARYSPNEFWVRNDQLLTAMSKGSRLVQAEVKEITGNSVHTDQGEFAADCLVIALGAYMHTGVKRRISQLAKVDYQLSHMMHVLDTGIYLRPNGDQCLIGDGDREVNNYDFDAPVETEFLSSMNIQMDAIFQAKVECRALSASTLAFTPDFRPVIRQEDGNWLMYGFGGDGLALAPAFGEEIAKVITG